MATISGSYRETHIATIAAMIVLIDAHLTAENARMVALGGAATGSTIGGAAASWYGAGVGAIIGAAVGAAGGLVGRNVM